MRFGSGSSSEVPQGFEAWYLPEIKTPRKNGSRKESVVMSPCGKKKSLDCLVCAWKQYLIGCAKNSSTSPPWSALEEV